MRIGLTGTFHSANRGDASIQLAAVLELQKQFPDSEITLFSSSPEDDAAVYPGVRVMPTSRRRPRPAVIALLQAYAARFTKGKRLPPELEEMKKLDVLIDLSGDGFTDTFGWKCPASHAIPLLYAKALDLPYVLMSQTVGPFRRGNRLYGKLFDDALSISCRDEESVQAARAMVSKPRIELTADIAFLLPPQAGPKLSPYSHLKYSPVAGITPSNLHNVRNNSDRAVLLDLLAAAGNKLIEETGAQVLIIPTVFGPGEAYDDRAAARELAERLPSKSVMVCEDALEPRELKALIGMCDLYIGVRMHGLIHALAQLVPSLAIAYAPKTHNLFRRIAMTDLAVDMRQVEPGNFAGMAVDLWNDRARMRRMLEHSLQTDLLPAARRNVKIVSEHMQLTETFPQRP